MADNQEEVVYEFTGDVTSLRDATQEAISWLDKYDDTMKRVASGDTFKASKTSATSFKRVVGGLIKQVNTLTTSLNKAGQGIDSAMPDSTAVVKEATQSFADVLDYLDKSTTVTSKDLQFLTEVLKETRTGLDPIIARASLLSSSLKPLEQLQVAQKIEETAAAATKVQKHYEAAAAAGFRVQDAYQASGKAAVDSAIAFLKAERASIGMTNVNNVARKLRTEMNLLGAYATKFWQGFTQQFDPVISRLQSFKSKTEKVFGSIKSVFDQVSQAFRRVSKSADDEGDDLDDLGTKSEKLSKRLQNLHGSARKSASGFNVFSKATSALKLALGGLIGFKLSDWLSEAAKQSIKYTENLNLFTVAMGDFVDEGTAFVNTMSEMYGMDPSNLMRYAGNFYQLADAISMPDKAAANLSLGLTKATNDIASLFNVDIETVFNDLSSGMQGMSRAVRKYGMDIRTNTLQQTALSLGITESVQSMSEANRQGLRFITMMRQASNASGDFAKTIESPANQLRIFKEQMSQLGRAIGNLFITPLATAIQYINGFVMALRMVISFIASLFGLYTESASGAVNVSEDIADSVGGIGSAAGSAAKKLKGMLAPFDELNVLQKADTGGGGGGGLGGLSDVGNLDPAIEQAIADMQWQLENVRMKANDVRDAILEFLGFTVEDGQILSWDAALLKENIGSVLATINESLHTLMPNFMGTLQSIGEAVVALWQESIQPMLVAIVDAIKPVVQSLIDLWEDLVAIVSDIFSSIGDLWDSAAAPALTAFFEALTKLAELFGALWSQWVAPVLKHVGEGLVELWINTISPIVENIIAIVLGVIEIILQLWNKVLGPLVTWLADVLGPIVTSVFNAVWSIIQFVISNIGQSINGLLEILRGVIDFIAGVFAGDWERVWKGVVEIFSGVWDTLAGVVKLVFNSIIAVINVVLSSISGAINSIIRAVNKISFKAPDWVPGVGGKTLGFNIRQVSTWSIPYLASGAVVTSPTLAMVGEGQYDEAVIPLGNSPQMKELVNQIASATRGRGSDEPIQVNVFIGNEQVAEYMHKAERRHQLQTNGGI